MRFHRNIDTCVFFTQLTLDDDPVYGKDAGIYMGLALGRIQVRGKTGALTLPLTQFMRLRHNPFFNFVEKRWAANVDNCGAQGEVIVLIPPLSCPWTTLWNFWFP